MDEFKDSKNKINIRDIKSSFIIKKMLLIAIQLIAMKNLLKK